MAGRKNEFHPEKSQVAPSDLAAFIASDLTGELTDIPGVGPKTAELFGRCSIIHDSERGPIRIDGITSIFGLIGVYLSFKNGKDKDGKPRVVGPVEHTQKFYLWLQHVSTNGKFRAGIVRCIAEKVNVSFPGIYDPTAYGDLVEAE